MKKVNILVLISCIILAIVSCKSKRIEPIKEIGLTDIDAVNSIKLIRDSLYLLEASHSKLYSLNDYDGLDLVFPLSLKGRAFLQDFIFYKNYLFFSNTYYEFFKYNKKSEVIDTIKISSPDKIIKFGDNIFVTERISGKNLRINGFSLEKDGYVFILPLDDIKGKAVIAQDCFLGKSDNFLFVLSNSRKQLFRIDKNLNIVKYDLPYTRKIDFEIGSLYVNNTGGETKLSCLAKSKQNLFLLQFKFNNEILNLDEVLSLRDGDYDISISAIGQNKIYIYNYIEQKIVIFPY